MGYWKKLKTHPGLEYGVMFTILGALAGATNQTAEWWVGAIFGAALVGVFAWGLILISNFSRR